MKKMFLIALTLAALLLSACGMSPDRLPEDAPEIKGGAAGEAERLQPVPDIPEIKAEIPETEPETPYARRPMVMIDGELYYGTGQKSETLRCGMMDGKIESSVPVWEIPTENGQSNFGEGFGYQYGVEGTVEISIDGEWIIFEKEP